uniref:helix-turn-helix domain-containing protein n=1 Tax=Mediterraneibacter glycyrrhizinilyticus TaxID=342942 RepID=UPI000B057661
MRENGVQLQIRKKIKEEISFLPDVRLYYIIEGMLEVQIEKKCYRMKKDDILVINVGVRAGKIETYESDALICELCFENRILAELLENENGRFVCNSVEHPGQSYERLKKIIQQILRQRGLNLHKTKSYEYSLIYQLLDELIEHYWIVNSELQVSREVTDPRLEEILRYVHCNHSAHISLAEVAEKLYVSTSTLSRFFKKQTGMYFAEYVGKIRLHYAENELKNTSHSITEVAMHCGFSNVQALNKVFREKRQMTPTEFREQWTKRKKREEEDWKETVRQDLQKTEWFYEMQENAVDQIRIDTSGQSESRLPKIWKRAINIGSMHRLGEVNIQFQTQRLVNELGFTHVRVWNIFFGTTDDHGRKKSGKL